MSHSKKPKRFSSLGTVHRRSGSVRRGTLALLGVAAAVGGGYAWWSLSGGGSNRAAIEPMLHSVAQGPFDHIVLEQGEIESSSNNEVKCEVKGRGGSGTPILTVIAEGTMVKKGDLLCQLDSSALEQEAKNQRIVVSTAESAVISSEAAVNKAIIARQEYLDGTFLTERKTILSEIAVAQQTLRKAELSLESAERLAAKGTLKPLQIEAEQYAVQNAKNTLESAEGRLRVLDELTKAKMLVQFDADIETTKAKLESDKSTLAEEKEKLEEIQSQIAACKIIAPADGQVVYANKFSGRGGGEFIVEAGALVREQQTIFLLPDPTRMQVKAKINESRISLIREGMPVKIRVNAVENELLGRVIKVNKYAEPGNWWGSNVKEYATFVQIMDPPETIRTGMTAEVRIFVEQIEDAIQIPVHAVYETKRHHFALVRNGDRYETREIEIGATNDSFVTVKSGVKSNENVVLDPRNHLDKMVIPEIREEDDRSRLVALSNEPLPKAPASAAVAEGNAAGGSGGTPGGPGGGMNSDAIAGMIMQRMDTNADGKLSKEEVAGEERMKAGFTEYDANGDGSVDAKELAAGMKKRMAAMGAGGAGGGGRGPGFGANSN
ncbi:MAG: HlyD family efflux transporter periplasmic adaptor subunit [Pirellula sp.]|jgi:RND family efflux transporter MFP subunit|nr:HlyD family efflux transporter periplasmic adaptor subunit [Pirellula sp.]